MMTVFTTSTDPLELCITDAPARVLREKYLNIQKVASLAPVPTHTPTFPQVSLVESPFVPSPALVNRLLSKCLYLSFLNVNCILQVGSKKVLGVGTMCSGVPLPASSGAYTHSQAALLAESPIL